MWMTARTTKLTVTHYKTNIDIDDRYLKTYFVSSGVNSVFVGLGQSLTDLLTRYFFQADSHSTLGKGR